MVDKCVVVICCVLGLSWSLPLEPVYLETGDTEVVGSVIREVRAAPPPAAEVTDLLQAGTGQDPDNFEHHWNSGDKGPKGYLKKNSEKGTDGYKHFDSFHKQDGDNYGFEHHTSFGKGAKDGKDGYQHHSKYQKADDGGKKDASKQGTHNSYQVSENVSDWAEVILVGVETNNINLNTLLGHDPSYDGDSASYTSYDGDYGGVDGGSASGHYSSDGGGDGESGQFVEGTEGEYHSEDGGAADAGSSEQYTEGDAYSGQYVDDGGDGENAGYYAEGDSGESQHYTADDDYDDY